MNPLKQPTNIYNKVTPKKFKNGENIASGLGARDRIEAVPVYNSTSGQKVDNKANAWITMGYVPPAGPLTGYAGLGMDNSSAIDICVGRKGVDDNGNPLAVDNNFGMQPGTPGDSARIYVAETADIDRYFGLPFSGPYIMHKNNDEQLGSSIGYSAIAAKADDIRLISRRGIKMVTGGPDTKNSKDRLNEMVYGVDIIAASRTEPDEDGIPYLQPMVKGYYLRECLVENTQQVEIMLSYVKDLTKTILWLTNYILKDKRIIEVDPVLMTGVANPNPVLSYGLKNIAINSRKMMMDITSTRNLIRDYKIDYNLNPTKARGARDFLSEYNNVN